MSWFTKMIGLDKATNKNPGLKRAIDGVTKPINDALKAEAKTALDGLVYQEIIKTLEQVGAPTVIANAISLEYPAWREAFLKQLFK